MTDPRAGNEPRPPAGSPIGRISRAWRALPYERRLAVGASVGLLLTLFLPWYQDTVIASGASGAASLRLASASITGWGGFSFVEAAVLLVAAGVLVLLFIRAEGRAFHVPGGDGGVITAAGFWTCVLILWRIFDKSGAHGDHGQYLTSTGIEWGILIALGVAGFLAYAGTRIRFAHEPEPPLPGERSAPRRASRSAAAAAAIKSRRPRTPPPVAAEPRQAAGPVWSDEPATQRVRPEEAPTQPGRPEEPPTQHLLSSDHAPTEPGGGPEHAPEQERPTNRGLDLHELEEVEFDDPPTARFARSRRRGRRLPDPDDHLTIRTDRKD